MRKGFTLIELLAVILILGIIALIAVPTVSNIVKESKKNSIISSVTNITKKVEEKCLRQIINGENPDTLYTIKNGQADKDLEIKGSLPDNGVITLDSDCNAKTISFNDKYITITTAGETIIKDNNSLYLDNTTEGRFIYRGDNPDNFIFLNDNQANSLYRIIAYEPDGTMKVMKYYPYFSTTFDAEGVRNIAGTYCSTGGCNAYAQTIGEDKYSNGGASGKVVGNSTMFTFLNETYYNEISDEMKSIIKDHDFNIGGITHTLNSGTGPNEQQIVSNEKKNNWNGKIGLITVSDYLKATTNKECDSSKNLYISSATSSYEHYKCGEDNYMNYYRYMWTMTPLLSNPRNVYVIWYNGGVNRAYAQNSIMIANPVFYIDGKKALSGEGTYENPFRIIGQELDIAAE